MKKLLCTLLCVMLVVTMMPVTAWAEEGIGPFPAELYWSKAPDNADGSEPKGIEWYSGEPLVMQEGESVRAYFGIETEDGIVAINADPSTIRTQEGVSISGRTNYMYTITAEGTGNFWILYEGPDQDYEMGVQVEEDGNFNNAGPIFWLPVQESDRLDEFMADPAGFNNCFAKGPVGMVEEGYFAVIYNDNAVLLSLENFDAESVSDKVSITEGEDGALCFEFLKEETFGINASYEDAAYCIEVIDLGGGSGDGGNNAECLWWAYVPEGADAMQMPAETVEWSDGKLELAKGGSAVDIYLAFRNGEVLVPLGSESAIGQDIEYGNGRTITVTKNTASGYVYTVTPGAVDADSWIAFQRPEGAEYVMDVKVGEGAETAYNISMEILADTSEWPDASEHIMWHYGQGVNMQFNSKITSWYSCFYVENMTTGYDARFEWTPENPHEVRTYVGGDGEYVIEAEPKDNSSSWAPITNLAEEYQVYSISYLGEKKGYSPIFQIRLNAELDDVSKATDLYRFRIRYTGEDVYLDNGNPRNWRNIMLDRNEEMDEFNIDEYWFDENGNPNTGNVLRFDYVGEAIKFKLNIRPGVLQSAADKKIYREDDYIYVEPSETNGADFIRLFEQKRDEWVEIPDDENPFVITWDETEKLYTITYAEPDEDLHGPHYMMTYTGDYDSLINQKYGYAEGTKSNVGADSTFTTGKITLHVDDVGNGSIDATTEDKVIGTEIVLGDGALEGYEDEELHFETNDGSITLGGDLVGNIKITDKKIHLKMWNVKEDDHYLVSDKQKNEVKKCIKAFDFKIDTKDADIEFGEDGYAVIRIPYDGSKGYVYYINDKGEKEYIDCVTKDGYIQFTVKHFSTYAISTEMPEDGNPDYELEVNMPNSMNYWLPGVSNHLWTNLRQLIREDEYNSHWEHVNDYTLVPTVTMNHVCTDKADASAEALTGDESRAFELKLPGSCAEGCTAAVEVKAYINDEFVKKTTFNVHVADEMYAIRHTGTEFDETLEMGEVLNFKDALTVEKITTTTTDGWTVVENPTFRMDYDKERWQPDGEGANGLYNLKKISPYGDGIEVKVVVDGNEVARRGYGFNGYDFWANFNFSNGREVSIAQQTATFTLNKSTALAADTTHDIKFVLGAMNDEGVITPFATQTGLFEYVTETENDIVKVTGIRLNIAEILKQCTFEGRSYRLGIQINVEKNDVAYTLRNEHVWLRVPDYHISWNTDGQPLLLSNQEVKTIYFNKNDAMNNDSGYELSFRLGIWNRDEEKIDFFESQEGLCEPFREPVYGEGNEITGYGDVVGLTLYPQKIAEALGNAFTDDGEADFEIQPFVTINNRTYSIGNSRDCFILVGGLCEYDEMWDRYMLPGEGNGVDRTIWGYVRDEDEPDGYEVWLPVVSVTSDNEAVAKIEQRDNGEYVIDSKGLGTATITLVHEGIGNTITQEFDVHVVDDLWRCEVDPVNRTSGAAGTLDYTVKAEAHHYKYNAERDEIYETGEDYTVDWELTC